MPVANPVLQVKHKDKDLLYAVVDDHTAWRVKTLLTKEEDTIAWIDGMKEGELLFDIGANMGIYTIYAAIFGKRVVSFEPEASNYALLCRSILINGLDVQALPLALSNEHRADWLYLSIATPGGSCHTFGENLDYKLTPRETQVRQGCYSVRLDDLRLGQPDHIKIDVDGLEHLVVSGAEKSISGAKSVLVEINANLVEHRALVQWFDKNGFRSDIEQVRKATRTEGPFKDCGNRIFWNSRFSCT